MEVGIDPIVLEILEKKGRITSLELAYAKNCTRRNAAEILNLLERKKYLKAESKQVLIKTGNQVKKSNVKVFTKQ